MLRRSLIVLGVLVALVPYLGLPRSFDTILTTFAGTTIVVLLIGARPRSDRSAPFIPPHTPSESTTEKSSPPLRANRRNDRSLERSRPTGDQSTSVQPRPNPTKELHVERLAMPPQRSSQVLEHPVVQSRKVPLTDLPAPALIETPVIATESVSGRPRPVRRKLASAQPVVGVIPAPETEALQMVGQTSPEKKVETRRRRPKIEHVETTPFAP